MEILDNLFFTKTALELSQTNNFLLQIKIPANDWVGIVFNTTLYLAIVGVLIILVLQVKTFKQNQAVMEVKAWESIWTIIPLLALVGLWWLF